MKDENLDVRIRSVKALGAIEPEAKVAIPELILLLKDKSLNLRSNAIKALGKVRPDAKAISALIQVSEDDKSDRWLRGWAIEAIESNRK